MTGEREQEVTTVEEQMQGNAVARSDQSNCAGAGASDLDARVTPGPDLLFSELDGEAVVLDLGSGNYFGLNSVGARAWELLAQGRHLRAVRDALLKEFDVDESRCEGDLLSLVGQLERDGLVRVNH
jgi:hypothetical protein